MVEFTDAHKADDWTEIGGGDANQEMWNREGTITGKYTNKQTNVGPNDSNVYTLETENGSVGVWGSTVLDTKFEQITLGSLVKIESLGKVQGKKAQYYDYKVFSKGAPTAPKEVTDVFPGAEVAA
jgi:hypothetical protein